MGKVRGRRRGFVVFTYAVAVMLMRGGGARAADKYWDLNGAAGGAGANPTGTWNTSNVYWNTDPLGADGGSVTTWAAGDNAIFSAGTDAVAYTVNLSGIQTAAAVLVEDGILTIGSGTSINTGAGTFKIGTGASSTARVNIPNSTRLNAGGKVLLDGGTLINTNPNTGNAFINAAKDLEITNAGGTVGYDDGVSFFEAATIYQGTITGAGGSITNGGLGTLTKSGPDEFRYQGATTSNTTFAKLAVVDGLFRLGSATLSGVQQTTETGFGAAPLSHLPDAISLSNGGAIGTSFTVTLHPNRGITLGTGGGAFNTALGQMTVPGTITGAGNLLKNTSGVLLLTGDNNAGGWTGKVIVTGGTLGINADNALGVVPSAGPVADAIQLGGTLQTSSSMTLNGNRGITLANGGGTISTSTGTLTYAGRITGTGPLSKTGPGTLSLAGGANDFIGNLHLAAGTLYLDHDHALPSTAVIAIGPTSAAVALGHGDAGPGTTRSIANDIILDGPSCELIALADSTLNLNGTISGSGALVRTSTGGLGTVALNGNNADWTGGVTIERGFLALGHKNALGSGQLRVVPGDTSPPQLRASTPGLVGASAIPNEIQIAQSTLILGGAHDYELAGRIIDASAVEAGTLIKDGANTVTLSGDNTYTGTTTVSVGRLHVTKPAALPGYNAPGKVVVGIGATLSVRVGTDWTAADVDTLRANATLNGALGFDTANAVGAFTYASNISGAHGVTKLGGGTLDLSGDNTYTGGTTVDAGTLQIRRLHENNSVNITGGTLKVVESSPGLGTGHPAGDNALVSQPSALTIAPGGTLDLTNNDLILDYSGVSPIATYEALVASAYNVGVGDWSGSGITSSAAAADGNYVIAIADNALLAAPFGTAQGGPLFSGVDVDLDTILVKFTHRADVDLDGVITPNDAAIFGGNYSENDPAYWTIGDMDYDGIFSPTDAAIFGGFYDESLMSLPEPNLLCLLGALGLTLARRRWVSAGLGCHASSEPLQTQSFNTADIRSLLPQSRKGLPFLIAIGGF